MPHVKAEIANNDDVADARARLIEVCGAEHPYVDALLKHTLDEETAKNDLIVERQQHLLDHAAMLKRKQVEADEKDAEFRRIQDEDRGWRNGFLNPVPGVKTTKGGSISSKFWAYATELDGTENWHWGV